MATTPTTTNTDQQPVASLNTTLAAAADVQRLDVNAMHEKVSGILAVIIEPATRTSGATAGWHTASAHVIVNAHK